MVNSLVLKWESQTVQVADLKPFEKNPRSISPSAYAKLLESLREDGYHQRILATRDLRVIGGHQRIKALQELGIAEIEILVPDQEIPEEQFKRILVRDNLGFGEWDVEGLGELMPIGELIELGVQPDLFPRTVLAPAAGEDDVPEAPAEPVSKPGDIWILGDHRIMCGSSTDAENVAALLAGARPMLMVTDPPYGVKYDASWRNEALDAWKAPRSTGKVMNDDQADWTEAWRLFPGDVAYVWHADKFSPTVARSLEACDFKMRNLIVWAKQHFVLSRGDYHHQHEPCWYAVRKNGKGHWTGDRKQTTLWEIANACAMGGMKDDATTGHSTQKPVECMLRPILNNSAEGDAIYEPFSGSGTTIIAAEKSGRRCYAMELNPAYVDMAVKRWEKFTGKTAVLEKQAVAA